MIFMAQRSETTSQKINSLLLTSFFKLKWRSIFRPQWILESISWSGADKKLWVKSKKQSSRSFATNSTSFLSTSGNSPFWPVRHKRSVDSKWRNSLTLSQSPRISFSHKPTILQNGKPLKRIFMSKRHTTLSFSANTWKSLT